MEISQLNSITETDAQQIQQLAIQLGYVSQINLLVDRLAAIVKLNDHAIFVAKLDHKIVGWLHCLICLRVESPLFVEVTGLVVDENARGKHVGKNLVEASKKWSIEQNIMQIVIRCNVIRTESHKFYQSLGFSLSKEQKVFQLSL